MAGMHMQYSWQRWATEHEVANKTALHFLKTTKEAITLVAPHPSPLSTAWMSPSNHSCGHAVRNQDGIGNVFNGNGILTIVRDHDLIWLKIPVFSAP